METVELIKSVPGQASPYVFTCEHATNALPRGIEVSNKDRELLDDHWGWDIGAEDVTRAFAKHFGAAAVLARLSRLYVDCNRDPRSKDLVVREAEGHAISFNQNLNPGDIETRMAEVFAPYHETIDRELSARAAQATTAPTLFSVHSFTPVYLGQKRTVEIGVLFDEHDDLAMRLAKRISSAGFHCELNQPYSGKPPNGLIYSAGRHGRDHRVPYLELEIRHDLIESKESAAAIAARLTGPLADL